MAPKLLLVLYVKDYCMNLTKTIQSILYISAFIYLVMCPAVHQLGDIIRHDVILKFGVQLQESNLKNDCTIEPFNQPYNITTSDFTQDRTQCVEAYTPPSFLSSELSVLSTVKLIL